jgi:hypothetical protein
MLSDEGLHYIPAWVGQVVRSARLLSASVLKAGAFF